MRPARSSSLNFSQFDQWPTRFEFAMSTRGARIDVGAWVSVSTGMRRCYFVRAAGYNLTVKARIVGVYTSNVFFVILSKIFISNRLRARGMAGYGQNLEAQGRIRKIFRNKDLASDLEPLRRSVV